MRAGAGLRARRRTARPGCSTVFGVVGGRLYEVFKPGSDFSYDLKPALTRGDAPKIQKFKVFEENQVLYRGEGLCVCTTEHDTQWSCI